MADGPLSGFSSLAQTWFEGAFASPTPAQAGAWAAVASGGDALVVAPTGSGKTLAAFLWALDRMASAPTPPKAERLRVVYVSPLKALAVDIERNLRGPLAGMTQAAAAAGLPAPQIATAIRTGDTPAEDRRRFGREPPDILITTPESLFLVLTSAAREALRHVETVIIDEVHAVAGTKRGAHLALSLERLDELLARPAQRIGLSATVRPHEEVARFLGGAGRTVQVVAPLAVKEFDIRVVVPVEDMTAPGTVTFDEDGRLEPDQPPRERASVWPAVEERIVDLIEANRSTIVFANSRRLAERLCARLNEIAVERRTGEAMADPDRVPAEYIAQGGHGKGAPVEIARAHHGSVSREQRLLIEEDLKSGRLPAVVATSSLELGIDMGAVDLVIQVESPPSVASGLQRIGRGGHHVGAVSTGVLFPKFRGDLVETAVVVERMRAGLIEEIRYPRNPLDVLAQQVVAMVAMDEWAVEDLRAVVRRAAPFADIPDSAFHGVLDMLAGRYPSDGFAELRPRLNWDRGDRPVDAEGGRARLAVTSGGTIPDRGLFGVHLAGEKGTRVGELDEEMVYESRVGDMFVLGATTWRIEDITRDRVLVTPAPGQPGRMPFWHGDAPGRPVELGRALGATLRELGGLRDEARLERLRAAGLDENAAANLVAYLDEQREATGVLPDDRTIVVERFRDEIGDWRVCILSPFGAPVHAPWAQAIETRVTERLGLGGPDDVLGRRDRGPAARGRRGAAGRFDPVRARGGRGPRPGPGGLVRALRREVPGGRGPGAAPATPPARSPDAAVAAASAFGDPAAGRVAVPGVPDRPRDVPRVPPGRVRPAGAGRADGVRAAARGAGRRGGHPVGLAIRVVAAFRLYRGVHVRGRRADRRAPRAGAHAGPGGPGRAARARTAPRPYRSRGARTARARTPTPGRRSERNVT